MIVYICSPYRGDTKRNKAYARKLTRDCLLDGDIPITPHLYITEVLDDEKPNERILGTDIGIELLTVCNKLLVGTRYGISEGMFKEIEMARKWGVRIEYKEDCYENL